MTELDKIIKALVEKKKKTENVIDNEKIIKKIVRCYAKGFNLDEIDVFNALEKQRNCNICNYYQLSKFPSLNEITVFEDEKEMRKIIQPNKGFRCPNCKGVSMDPYVCNSAKEVKGKVCDWKAFGLFHTFGQGFKFTIKKNWLDFSVIGEIFYPIAMEN